jgi:hypothetical protein
MLHKKLALVFLLTTLLPLTSFSQRTYFIQTIDFNDSINSKRITSNTDNLATILIDGYLTGTLPAYQFSIGEEVLKRAPLSPDFIPPKWESKYPSPYFIGDRVSYEGQYFECVQESSAATPPTRSDTWQKITLLGEPISTRYYFPTPGDTLRKKDFLAAMVMEEPIQFASWYREYEYYEADIVTYNGRNYEALKNNSDKAPATNPDTWQPTSQGSLRLYSPREFTIIRLLSHREEVAGQVIMNPMMLSMMVYDDNRGFAKSIGLHFYFSDVVQYLDKVKQPMLYISETGYLGQSRFVLTEERKVVLLNTIKSSLKSKKFKLNKKLITSPTRYNEFLTGPEITEPLGRWDIFQNLVTGNLHLTERKTTENFVSVSIPVAVIPAASFNSILPPNNITFTTLGEAISGSLLHAVDYDTLQLDSLTPLSSTRVTRSKAVQKFFWLESYKSTIDSLDNKSQAQLLNIWNTLSNAFNKKELTLKNPSQSFYPCRFGVLEEIHFGNSDWTFDPDYQFGYSDKLVVDSLDKPISFTQYAVTYKKMISTQTKPGTIDYMPFEISFLFFPAGDNYYPITYTMRWNEVKNALLKSAAFSEFINGVERATINFSGTEIVYGVLTEK